MQEKAQSSQKLAKMQICAASIKKNVEGLLESKQKGNLLPPRATAAC
jgi:hypothetical protein